MTISVIIPAFNEEKHLIHNLYTIRNALLDLGYTYQIIVVNDCSTDDTAFITQPILEENKIMIYNKSVRQGKGSALKTGWKFAKGDYCVFMDADLQISPAEIKTFFKQMDHFDAEVVVGNKKHPFSNVEYPFRRKIISFFYNLIIRILFGLPLRDTQCGFKLFKRSALDVVMHKVLVKEFAFDLEVLVALRENNIRVVDAPVFVRKPLGNGSATTENMWRTGKDTLAVWYRKQKGWYKNK